MLLLKTNQEATEEDFHSFEVLPKNARPSPEKKREIAMEALAGKKITDIAKKFGVSRKCVYFQKSVAEKAIEQAFQPKTTPDQKVLFNVEFTPALISRLVLALFLCGKASYRSIQRIFEEVFSYHLSLGKLSGIINDASKKAIAINASYDLSSIEVGCHDEIYHEGIPLAVAVEPFSRFCFLANSSENKLEDLWIESLNSLKERGYDPTYVVADGGSPLRSGLESVYPKMPCYYDIFHFIRYFGQAILGIKRAESLMKVYRNNAQQRIDRAVQNNYAPRDKDHENLNSCNESLIEIAEDIKILKAGIGRTLNQTTRIDLKKDERLASYEKTENAIDELCLKYCSRYESKAHRSIQNLVSIVTKQKQNILALYDQSPDVPKVRASSMVENFNYSLRMQIKRFSHLSDSFKELAIFYLNHQQFLVSKNKSRKGKSPAEILQGKKLPNWLDMLVPV